MSSAFRVQIGLGLFNSSSSLEMSSAFRVQIGLVLFNSSSSVNFSLMVFFFLFFLLFIRHFPVLLLLHSELDGVADELAVLLHDLLDLLLVIEVGLVLLHGQHDLRAPAQLLSFRIRLDCEGPPSAALPNVLLIVVVL